MNPSAAMISQAGPTLRCFLGSATAASVLAAGSEFKMRSLDWL